MKFNEESLVRLLDSLYAYALQGVPGTESVVSLANDYLKAHSGDPHEAAEALVKFQVAKCAASGFVSGVGGAFVLPVAVPADLAATYYVQLRMSAAIAHLHGHDLNSDQVKTFIFLTLVGDAVKDVMKDAGIEFGKELTRRALRFLSRELVFKLNKAVGRKLLGRLGERSALQLGRLVPVAGGIIGAGINTYYCYKVGSAARFLFSSTSCEEAA